MECLPFGHVSLRPGMSPRAAIGMVVTCFLARIVAYLAGQRPIGIRCLDFAELVGTVRSSFISDLE